MRETEVFTAVALIVKEIGLNACLGALGWEGWGAQGFGGAEVRWDRRVGEEF